MSAPDARTKPLKKTRARRQLKGHSDISDVFRGYWLPGADGKHKNLKKMMADKTLITPLQRFFASHAKLKRDKNRSTEGPGYMEMLDLVQGNLSADLGGLKFNYFGFNEECITILQCLRAEFLEKFMVFELKGYEHEGWSLLHVAEDTLLEDTLLLGLVESNGGGARRSTVLARAAAIIEEVLAKK